MSDRTRTDLHFLPYLRRGLAGHVSGSDPTAGAIGPAQIGLSVTVDGQPIPKTASLLGPHHVASVDASGILRRYPQPNAVDVEPNYFPLIEFAAPDLPWRFTPAAAGVKDRLRPWLALAVVDVEEPQIRYSTTSGATGALHVDPGALDQLPPIDEVWAWAHVQSSVPPESVADAVGNDPAALRSRIVCPRRLEPGKTYRAVLVNAFRAASGDVSEPAWDRTSGLSADLVVYDTWTFSTSAHAGDFEYLCELLEPESEAGELGLRRVDVTSCGLDVKWPRSPMTIDFVGALADLAVITDRAPHGNEAFSSVVEPILNDALSRTDEKPQRREYDALTDDPVVGLPFYGSWPSDADAVPDLGWARALNLRTDRRIAAGLGARTIRRNQERFMAAAWDQLGEIREAADELNRGRLAAEVGRSWQARVAATRDGDRISLAGEVLSWLRIENTPARRLIGESSAPSSIVDRAWMRRTPRSRGSAASTAYLKAASSTATAGDLRAFGYQHVAPPRGIHEVDSELTATRDPVPVFTPEILGHVEATGLTTAVGGTQFAKVLAERIRIGGTRSGPGLRTPPRPRPGPKRRASRARATTNDIASSVAAMDPLVSVRAALLARVPALASMSGEGLLPAEFQLAPEFVDALFYDLARIDAEVIVPGLGDFPNNRVRLLGVNAAFVSAYLVGANHEMAREFLWREYPTDLGGTFFQKFFDHDHPATVDVAPIGTWTPKSGLADNAPGAAASTVILIRADLVRRYPDVNVFVTPQDANGKADYGRAVQPGFEGRLGPDVLVFGFPVDPDNALGRNGGKEYLVVIEERTTAPRFGLDLERNGPLRTWDELAWTDFATADTHIGPGPMDDLGTPTIDGVEWGRNSAHQAAAVHQKPYRRVYPAGYLVGS